MSTSAVRIGIVTKVDVRSKIGFVWTPNVILESTFTIPEKEFGKVQVGSWIKVKKEDGITEFVEMTQPFLPTSTDVPLGVISVHTRIVFPPDDWGMKEYKNLVYSADFGNVGNFARKRLLERNKNGIKPCVIYRGYVSRIPFAKPNELLIKQYKTIWLLPAQELELLPESAPAFHCPWNEASGQANDCNSAFEVSNQEANNRKNNAECADIKPTNVNSITKIGSESDAEYDDDYCDEQSGSEAVDIHDKSIVKNGIDNEMLASNETDTNVGDEISYEPIQQNETTNIGVVIRCHPEYRLIWGKKHGCVILSTGGMADYANIQLAQWIAYECMETKECAPGIKYEALFYKPIEVEDVCLVDKDNKHVLCCTTISEVKSEVLPTPFAKQMVVFESTSIGRVLLPQSVGTALRKLGTKIQCIVRMLDDLEIDYPWELIKVMYGSEYISLEEILPILNAQEETPLDNKLESGQSITLVETVKSDSPSYNLSSQSQNEVNVVDSRSQVSYMKSEQLHTAAAKENLELDRYKPDPNRKVKALRMGIFVSKTANYGVVWNVRRGTIVVSPKHMGSLNPGIWVKTSVVHVLNPNDGDHQYVAVAPLEEIEQFLPLRSHAGVVQVRVIMEPGGREEKLFDASYLLRRSEVGKVYLPVSNLHYMPEHPEHKKLKAWVTLVENKYWIVCGNEFEEVDVEQSTTLCKSAGTLSVRSVSSANTLIDQCVKDLNSADSLPLNNVVPSSSFHSDIADNFRKQKVCSDNAVVLKSGSSLMNEKGDNVVRDESSQTTANEHELTFFSALRNVMKDEKVRKSIVECGHSRELMFVLKQLE